MLAELPYLGWQADGRICANGAMPCGRVCFCATTVCAERLVQQRVASPSAQIDPIESLKPCQVTSPLAMIKHCASCKRSQVPRLRNHRGWAAEQSLSVGSKQQVNPPVRTVNTQSGRKKECHGKTSLCSVKPCWQQESKATVLLEIAWSLARSCCCPGVCNLTRSPGRKNAAVWPSDTSCRCNVWSKAR